MRKHEFIVAWSVVFVLMLMGNLLPLNNTPVGYPAKNLLIRSDSVKILEPIEFYRSVQNPTTEPFDAVATVKYSPEIRTGPIPGLIELYRTESMLTNEECLHSKFTLTSDQIDRAYAAIVEYANADSDVARYRPGQPPRTSFSFPLLGKTLLQLLALFGIPTLVAYTGKLIIDKQVSMVLAKRRNAGLCIRCKYPCSSISDLRCPECGNFHTVPFESASETEDQSHA